MRISVKFENCGKSYNRHWLFRNLNLEMQAGEKWAFLGPNGSGKTTLTMLATSQVWPTEGKVSWFAADKSVPASAAFSLISLASPAMELPEEFNLTELFSLHGKSKPFRIQNPLEVMAEICAFSKSTFQKPVASFSSGMKQRVKLCLAAFSDTPILILDEPLTNLDKAGALVYAKLLAEFSEDRLLLVASNREDEYGMCTRFVRLSDGIAQVS